MYTLNINHFIIYKLYRCHEWNVDIKNTFSSSIANTALQVTSAHDQRYSTFKMAAEVIKKKKLTSETKNPRIHFPEAVSKQKWHYIKKKKKKKELRHLIVSCSVNSTHCPFHIIVAHRKWTVTFDLIWFFFTAKTIAPAPLLILRNNYADIRQETAYHLFFFSNTNG